MTKKVLIIDDDKEMCEEMTEVLKDEGHDISVALDGLEGKKLIEENHYNILLLDVKLPKINGLEILKSVREKNMKLKVLIITGDPLIKKLLKEKKGYENKEEDTLKLADAVIIKPFNIEIVLAKIKELLNAG